MAKRLAPFWSYVEPNGDCLEWTGAIHHGYGQYGARPAHRIAYEETVGPIPAGLQIDHLCRNTRCVNPEHLEAVTQRENGLRGYSLPARHARKTHCDYGHAFTPQNTHVAPDGERVCRACSCRRSMEYHARKRAAA